MSQRRPAPSDLLRTMLDGGNLGSDGIFHNASNGCRDCGAPHVTNVYIIVGGTLEAARGVIEAIGSLAPATVFRSQKPAGEADEGS